MPPSKSVEKRTELPPHPVPAQAHLYVAGMTADQRELHEMAVKLLGSSYFVERTKGFRAWKATKNSH